VNFLAIVKQDWQANKNNPKGRLVTFAFRLACLSHESKWPYRLIAIPYAILYRLLVEWGLGIELPWKLKVGPGLTVYHGTALVVNDRTKIGCNCILRHSTTIGVASTDVTHTAPAPQIGDHVDIGSNVVIIGSIKVGNHSRIGAGSVVIRDVPDHATVVGNPARVVNISSHS